MSGLMFLRRLDYFVSDYERSSGTQGSGTAAKLGGVPIGRTGHHGAIPLF